MSSPGWEPWLPQAGPRDWTPPVTVNRPPSPSGPQQRTTPPRRSSRWTKVTAWAAVAAIGTAGFVWSQQYGHVSDLAGKRACTPSVCDHPPRDCHRRATFHLPNGALVCQWGPGTGRLGPYRPCRVGTQPIDNPSDDQHESRRHDVHEYKNRPVAPVQCFGPR